MQTHELVSGAQRANLDTFFDLAGTMVDGVGKLAELHARFTRSTLKSALEIGQNAIVNPQDWLAIQSATVAPMAENVQSYSSEFWGIVSSAQTSMLKAAQEGSDTYVRRVQTFVENATKHAPSGSEAAVAALNSAIDAANEFYLTLGKTGQQAVEVAQSTVDVAAAAVSKSARRAIEQEQRAAIR
ncbi:MULTISPECIES: phasin family protein [unclassified Burkholderia]|uniref:phasin family protein n=1 Tax=unclassified Burkholderia TaxID=2613784 RepID=UPI002AB2ED20|nr:MULTISPECIES: phasin family protein [unclassified Burkholderia]